MCLVVFALDVHPDIPVLIAANRDEFHRRPAAAAHRWPDRCDVVGGRDLEQGGTWFALSRHGALAIVTNFRDPGHRVDAPRSRGNLVRDFVSDPGTPARAYLAGRLRAGDTYNGFNLVAADHTGVWYGSNRGAGPRQLGRGIWGLSNHFLDTPWPKVTSLKAAVTAALSSEADVLRERMFEALSSVVLPPDHDLPETGVGLERERMLSPAFIRSADYGTRCSTVVTIARDGNTVLVERSHDADGNLTGTNTIRWHVARPILIPAPDRIA
ncbi:MAG: hypothetical protein GC151_12810 [Betaproteobacteria bacterium]|nr:hypothetical protein [Betaproteobacteria bacterium]